MAGQKRIFTTPINTLIGSVERIFSTFSRVIWRIHRQLRQLRRCQRFLRAVDQVFTAAPGRPKPAQQPLPAIERAIERAIEYWRYPGPASFCGGAATGAEGLPSRARGFGLGQFAGRMRAPIEYRLAREAAGDMRGWWAVRQCRRCSRLPGLQRPGATRSAAALMRRVACQPAIISRPARRPRSAPHLR